MSYKKGAAALGALTQQNGGGNKSEITSFKSGTTLKVRVKGTEDLLQYYNYGVYKKVNSFVPKNPATRNEKGFIIGNPTPWDQASQYYFDLAKKTSNDTESEKLKVEGRKYKASEKFLMGFYDLEQGKDIVVDLTKAQALAVYEIILEYSEVDEDGKPIPDGDHLFKTMAFKLSKKGESTGTTVSLTPIISVEKGLSESERENFKKSADQQFNQELFDGVLYEADEKQQIENLVAAGFDITLIGLKIGGPSQDDDEVTPIEDADPTHNF
jgi:hypothetical protein